MLTVYIYRSHRCYALLVINTLVKHYAIYQHMCEVAHVTVPTVDIKYTTYVIISM
jgi:hypothetical protein